MLRMEEETSSNGLESHPNSDVVSGPTTRSLPRSAASMKPLKPGKPDHTVLKQPIRTSVTGLKQAVLALENCSNEIRGYMVNECNIIYECKTCMSLFRSLANFISHKRAFCRPGAHEYGGQHGGGGDWSQLHADEATVVVQAEEPVDTLVRADDFDLIDYSPSLELMKDLGILQEIENKPLAKISGGKKTIDKVVKELKAKVDNSFDEDYYKAKELRLESMRYSNKASFQTMGQKYTDLERARHPDTIIVDPFNRVLEPGHPSKFYRDSLVDFSANGSNTKKVRYPCVVCKKHFSKVITCIQHLMKAHKYSQEKANGQRHAIKKGAIRVSAATSGAIKVTPEQINDIRNRECVVRIRKLTKREIWRWTGGRVNSYLQQPHGHSFIIKPSLMPKSLLPTSDTSRPQSASTDSPNNNSKTVEVSSSNSSDNSNNSNNSDNGKDVVEVDGVELDSNVRVEVSTPDETIDCFGDTDDDDDVVSFKSMTQEKASTDPSSPPPFKEEDCNGVASAKPEQVFESFHVESQTSSSSSSSSSSSINGNTTSSLPSAQSNGISRKASRKQAPTQIARVIYTSDPSESLTKIEDNSNGKQRENHFQEKKSETSASKNEKDETVGGGDENESDTSTKHFNRKRKRMDSEKSSPSSSGRSTPHSSPKTKEARVAAADPAKSAPASAGNSEKENQRVTRNRAMAPSSKISS